VTTRNASAAARVPPGPGPSPAAPASFPFGLGAAFVLVWSSGYIAGPVGVEAIGPMRLLTLRFVLAAVVIGSLALWRRGRPRMDRATLNRVCLVGLAMNAFQFGLMYTAFDLGLGATLGSLLHSVSPVLTVVLAGVLLRERVRLLQVVGLAVGVVGVVLVLGPDVAEAGGPAAIALGLLSMLSLSLGTMGQRWIPASVDPWWSATVQLAVSVPPVAVLALVLEGATPVEDAAAAAGSVVFLAVVNSVLGLLLLGALVRRGGAGSSASVFFLMPPVTAVLAFLVLGDTLGGLELVGIAVAVVGVALGTVRLRRGPSRPARDEVSSAGPS